MFEKDINKAIKYWEAGVNLGSADCMYSIAICNRTGTGVPVNSEKAFSMLKSLADEKNHPHAQVGYIQSNFVLICII